MRIKSLILVTTLGVWACGDDDGGDDDRKADAAPADAGHDAARPDGGGSQMDASSDAAMDSAVVDANVAPDAGGDASIVVDSGTVDSGTVDSGAAQAEKIARGKYLVDNVGACGDCHTPRDQMQRPIMDKYLSGADCFVNLTPGDTSGCALSTRNLTNHETGLKNHSDAEVKNMFTKGVRPDGTALHPVMPYYVYGNMTDADADAIVAYLRTVPGVDHTVQPAIDAFKVPSPAPIWPDAKIPQPRDDYPQKDAALRGRYLAGRIGVCMECHTPRADMRVDFDRAFEGGEGFDIGPPFPDPVYSSNITPDEETGIGGYDVAGIVKVLKQGLDKDNAGICPPMPAGPMAAFGGLTDGDATDIAHYLLSIPAKTNMIPHGCTPPAGP